MLLQCCYCMYCSITSTVCVTKYILSKSSDNKSGWQQYVNTNWATFPNQQVCSVSGTLKSSLTNTGQYFPWNVRTFPTYQLHQERLFAVWLLMYVHQYAFTRQYRLIPFVFKGRSNCSERIGERGGLCGVTSVGGIATWSQGQDCERRVPNGKKANEYFQRETWTLQLKVKDSNSGYLLKLGRDPL